MTAFSIFATFEETGRRKGYKSLFGWFKKLPWKDVRFLAPFIGMAAFIPGGAGGIINASYQMNALIHNTIWVTGHFHLTAATTVILTFFRHHILACPTFNRQKANAEAEQTWDYPNIYLDNWYDNYVYRYAYPGIARWTTSF
jgi:heme/copper-type cytochrome/quinol oxidase subunit 1